MDLRGLLTDERAISPVVGVVLLVAGVLLLAAVVTSFLLGFGAQQEVAPQVSFEYEYDLDQTLTIRVAGGDSFDANRVTIQDDFKSDNVVFQGTALGNYTGSTWTEADDDLTSSTRVSAGDQVALDDIRDPAFELDIVWTAEDGDDSTILGSKTGPIV